LNEAKKDFNKTGQIQELGSPEFKPSEKVFENVNEEKVLNKKIFWILKLEKVLVFGLLFCKRLSQDFFMFALNVRKKLFLVQKDLFARNIIKLCQKKRVLINIVLDDGTETIRSVYFHEAVPKLGLTELENQELLIQQRENLLGKENVFF